MCDDGFFHGDPHPGNFFIEPGGRIGLIDFGMVGRVDERTRERLADLLIAISNRDVERLVDVDLELGVSQGPVDSESLQRDLEHLLSVYWGPALKSLKLGPLLNDLFAVMRDHHLHLPSNLALMLKGLIMVEGMGGSLFELKDTGHEIPQTHPESIYSALSLISQSTGALVATN